MLNLRCSSSRETATEQQRPPLLLGLCCYVIHNARALGINTDERDETCNVCRARANSTEREKTPRNLSLRISSSVPVVAKRNRVDTDNVRTSRRIPKGDLCALRHRVGNIVVRSKVPASDNTRGSVLNAPGSASWDQFEPLTAQIN